MDEFTYVVSHDLQEPLRTLIAFSDFLLRDYGDGSTPTARSMSATWSMRRGGCGR